MNKKILIIMITIIAIIIVSTLAYMTYISANVYEDDRIKINVPTGTEFSIKVEDSGNNFNNIIYNDTSEKNIVIKMIMVPNSTILGMSVKDLGLGALEKNLDNESYVSVKITENYTIYKNEKTGRYNALIRNPGYNGYVLIGCNGDLEDIEELAKTFEFKSYTTEGLTIVKVNNTDSNTDSSTNTSSNSSFSLQNNDNETNNSNEKTSKNNGGGDTPYDNYVKDGGTLSEEEYYAELW
ncbi:hypothetical protein MARBORIA2_05170 [Methanobrevibacter arboriphilus]|jgi:hypothetical protein|uniref:Uncharacterized protein n=1 Tax=Methanobrevibacter arboriphilus TaxID=39441 RepID=A0ACA8R146_METAZ|nr:hypothetical protein [Methanobrevibacter arboriphilus]BBL61240.1 hypothetical protein MarbSA_02800 [Methanobrevibacter arboriphilus]GLI11427.1 hypothetical protein MARBORIA2_05170 [Methanobrevibacter arboriphilus]